MAPGWIWLAGWKLLYPALQSPVCVFLYLDVLGLCVRMHPSKPDGKEAMSLGRELWGCTAKGAGVTRSGVALVYVARQTGSVQTGG